MLSLQKWIRRQKEEKENREKVKFSGRSQDLTNSSVPLFVTISLVCPDFLCFLFACLFTTCWRALIPSIFSLLYLATLILQGLSYLLISNKALSYHFYII